MDYSRSTEIKVGVLVTVGILLLIVTIMMLGGDKSIFRKKYHLSVRFEQVQGLGPGSVVQLLGIPIGNVEDMKFLQQDGRQVLDVWMKLDKSFQNRITEGSTADVRTQGALGDKYIYITPGPVEAAPLPDGGTLVAKKSGGLFDTLAEKAEQIDKVFQILDEVHQLFKNLNGEGRSEQLMDNLVTSSSELKGLLRELRGTTGENGKKGLAHLSSILEKIDNGDGTLGALVNDPSLFQGLKRMLGSSPGNKYLKSLVRDTIQKSE